MENNIYYFLVYFLSGAFASALVLKSFQKVENISFFAKIELSVLKIYKALDHDIRTAMKIKYISLKDSNVSEDIITDVAKKDQLVLNKWRKSAINKLLLERPSSMINYNNYKTWNEAMNKIKKG